VISSLAPLCSVELLPYMVVLVSSKCSDIGSCVFLETFVAHCSSCQLLLAVSLIEFLSTVPYALLDGGIFDQGYFKTEAQNFAIAKQVTPMWHQIFLRAIGANWLVCMACYLGMFGRDIASKIIGIWFPTFAFVSLGFDHVVANMFFIPNGIWQGAPGLTVGMYIYKGIIPVLLGNMIGGKSFFIISAYSN
jgi:formate/nitrite transporter FocA (FNT family)